MERINSALVSRDFWAAAPGTPVLDDVPTATCPRCGAEVPDHDGFGVLAHLAPYHADGCGYCGHPSRDDGVCGLCGHDEDAPACACDDGACELHDGPAPA